MFNSYIIAEKSSKTAGGKKAVSWRETKLLGNRNEVRPQETVVFG